MIRLLSILFIILFTKPLCAQFNVKSLLEGESDSLYYSELKNYFTVKVFTAQKLSDFSYNDNLLNSDLRYKANPTRSLGVGMSYKWLSLNLGYGFSFANQDEDQLGETKRIDFRTSIHMRKLTIGLFSSIYQGYYLENSYDIIEDWPQHTYYTRADIKNLNVGITANYIFNSKHYSNKAAFMQNEWQKKTAGSLVAGVNAFYNRLSADSSFVPTNINDTDFYRGVNWNRNGYFAFGANVGYIFTWVVHQNFFINLGLVVGTALGNTSIYPIDEPKQTKLKLKATLLNDFGMGYNSERFYIGFNYSNFLSSSPSPIENTNMSISSGKIAFIIAYRLKVKPDKRFLPKWIPLDL